MRFLFAAMRMAPACLAVAPGIPAIAAPAVTLSQSVGHPQGATSLSGSGFGANETVDIYFDQLDVLLDVTSGAGKFGPDKINVSASAAPGDHWITAIGRKSGDAAHRKFVVSTAWASHGFNERGRRRNPYENIVNANNVARLDLAWRATTGNSVVSSPAVAQVGTTYNPFVFFGSTDNNLYAFDLAGNQKWVQALGGEVESSPAVVSGTVYVAADNGILYAFKASTGTPAWPAAVVIGAIRTTSPAVSKGVVYIGGGGGKLFALNASDGSLVWASAATGTAFSFSSPAVADGVAYIGGEDGKLYTFNTSDGSAAWPSPGVTGAAVEASPAVANGSVYIVSRDGGLYAFNAKTGAAVWPSPAASAGSTSSSPAVSNGYVFFGSNDGKLYAVNASSGTIAWTASTGLIDFSSPAVANGVVYVGSNSAGGKIFAFNANGCGVPTCSPLWTAQTAFSIQSSPAVSDGMVFVGSTDAQLYAFALDGGNTPSSRQRRVVPPAFAILHPDFRLKPVKHGG